LIMNGFTWEAIWKAIGYNPFRGMGIRCTICKKTITNGMPNPCICPECSATMVNSHDTPRDYEKFLPRTK
jgi:hypothetical protein